MGSNGSDVPFVTVNKTINELPVFDIDMTKCPAGINEMVYEYTEKMKPLLKKKAHEIIPQIDGILHFEFITKA